MGSISEWQWIHALIFCVHINHIHVGITEAKFEFEIITKKKIAFRTLMYVTGTYN